VGDPCFFLDVSIINLFYDHTLGDCLVCDINEL
jgi:hypothetical protein